MDAKDKIIVALDGMNYEEAIGLAEKLSNTHVSFKINDLLDDEGVGVISELKKFGGVMADPKLNDIPYTVKNRIRKYASRQPNFITIHASGGIDMMKTAVANKGGSRILAVTVLTSLNTKNVWDLGYVSCWQAEPWERYRNTVKERYIPNLVLEMAIQAKKAGVDGIVCSPQELKFLGEREELNNLLRVTPGIRPKWAEMKGDDQKRFMTPAEAIKAGANFLVIGRPITNPPPRIGSPANAVKMILDEINSVL